MIKNANITIYNKYIEDRKDKFQRTQIINPSSNYSVAWSGMKASTILSSGGKIASNSATILIPFVCGSNYLEPIEWQALTIKTGKWTLQDGDFIVKDLVDDEITEAITDGDVTTPAFTISS